MRKLPAIFSIITVCLLKTSLFLSVSEAQENTGIETFQSLAEELSAEDETGSNLDILADKIYELENDPVRINSGSIREISRLFFLTGHQIRSLAEYVRLNGRIISLTELMAIDGFDEGTVNMMAPFITLQTTSSNLLVRGTRFSQSILSNFSLKPGIADTATPGSPWKILTKYNITSGRFIAGFTAEKDAGERLLTGKPPSPDFLSAYLCYNGSGFLQKIIVGDYSARFGTGTVINTSFTTGMSIAEPGSIQVRCMVNPYTSTDENNFFRGVAAVLGKGKIETTLFASRNTVDASTAAMPGDSQKIIIRNLYSAGLHNTPGTVLKKDVLTETAWGINIAGYSRNLIAGFIITGSLFSIPFLPDRSKPENLFGFEGTRHTLAGIYYSLAAGRFLFSGETASDPVYNIAFTQSASFVPADRISFGIIYRNYPPAFVSFHGKGVLTGGRPLNEEALAGNVKFEAAKNLFILAGSEIKRHPWARYLTGFPSESVRSDIKIRFSKGTLNIEGIYNFRLSGSNLSNERGMPGIREIRTNSYSLRIQYRLSDYLTSVTRMYYKTCNEDSSPGSMIGQDIIWTPSSIPVRIWFRHCMFTTGSWNTRLYAWEYDLVNSFSIPVLSGRGTRNYLMAELKSGRWATLRIKYGITSGTSVNGNEKFSDEIKFQLMLRL